MTADAAPAPTSHRDVRGGPAIAYRPDRAALRTIRSLRVFWREKARPRWIAIRPAALLTLGISVLVLGTIGFERYTPEHYGFLDSFYRAITLFGLGGAVAPPVPVTLQFARIAAPILTGYAALGVIFVLSREQARVLAIRLFVR